MKELYIVNLGSTACNVIGALVYDGWALNISHRFYLLNLVTIITKVS